MRNLSPRSRAAFLILGAGIALFVYWIPGPQSRTPDPIQEPSAPLISAGLTAYLSDSGRSIGVGADVETFTALARAVADKDRRAYEHLFQDGRAFLVTDSVQVLIVGFEGDSAQVRFLDGYHTGKMGWVLREWLKAAP